MPKAVDQFKAGLKGIRGAGDVLRGEFMEATDRLFEKKNKPKDPVTRSKHNAIIEKGAQDMRGAGGIFARNKWAQKGMTHPHDAQNDPATTTAPAAPTTEAHPEARHEGELPSHRPVEPGVGGTAGDLRRDPIVAEGPTGNGAMRPSAGVGGYGDYDAGKDSGVGGVDRPRQGVGGYGPGKDSGVEGFEREPMAPVGYVPHPGGKPAEDFGREPGSDVPGYRY
jgi:hypothetical protein